MSKGSAHISIYKLRSQKAVQCRNFCPKGGNGIVLKICSYLFAKRRREITFHAANKKFSLIFSLKLILQLLTLRHNL